MTKTEVITIRMSAELRDAAEERASAQYRSVPEYIRNLISEDLCKDETRDRAIHDCAVAVHEYVRLMLDHDIHLVGYRIAEDLRKAEKEEGR